MKTYSLDTLKNSILPLCHGYEKPPKSIKETLGNTLILEYDERVWLLTCRHLMESVWPESMIKSVKLTEKANYFMMWKQKKNLRFHPTDNARDTMDLALYYFSGTHSFKPSDELWQWNHDYAEVQLHENDPLRILAIRSEQLTPESVVSSKPIPVEEIEGVYLDNTLDFSPEDYDRKLVNQQAVRVDTDDLLELSGGLVAARSDDGWYPRGIVTGSGTVSLKMRKDDAPQKTGIYTYTDLANLKQMLQPVTENS